MSNSGAVEGNKKTMMQAIKFLVVGGINTAIDFIVLYILVYFGMPASNAKLISYPCGVINSYFMNRSWTFKQKQKKSVLEVIKFIVVNIVAYGVNAGIFNICITTFALNMFIANCVATAFSLVVNFAGNKLFVFNK